MIAPGTFYGQANVHAAWFCQGGVMSETVGTVYN